MKNKVSFLFGAGISIDAGLPCVEKLNKLVKTDTYFNGEKVNNNRYDTFSQNKFKIKTNDLIELYQYFIKSLLIKYLQ